MVEGHEEGSLTAGEESNGAGDRRLLVVSRRSWLVSSLASMVGEVGLEVIRARTMEEALELAGPDVGMALVDHEVDAGEGEAGDVCRALAEGPLEGSVPILFYTPSTYASSDVHARALDAGAWAILREPLESSTLLALIRRLRRVGGMIRSSRAYDGLVDPETGLLTLSGLRRVLPSFGALAVRNQAPISFVVLGPTSGTSTNGDLRVRTAEVCAGNVRSADVCAWMSGDDLVIMAYDTPAGGARRLVQRLNELSAGELDGNGAEDGALSAGIVELRPREGLEEAVEATRGERAAGEGIPAPRFEDLFTLSAAREALEEARRRGGGVEVASVA